MMTDDASMKVTYGSIYSRTAHLKTAFFPQSDCLKFKQCDVFDWPIFENLVDNEKTIFEAVLVNLGC